MVNWVREGNVIEFEKLLERAPADAPYVRPASAWAAEVEAALYDGDGPKGLHLPWGKTHDTVRLRPAELSVWAGYNGAGKSLLHGQVQLALLEQNARICVASLEMPPRSTLERMAVQTFAGQLPQRQAFRAFFDDLTDLLWLYDQQGRVPWKRVAALARYCAAELRIDHFVIDSLMKCGLGVDDYTAQKDFVDELCAVAKDTGCHIHLIAHGRKADTERKVMDKHDVKGASEITDQADNVFTFWRNYAKEEKRQAGEAFDRVEPDAVLSVSKQRHGDWTGKINLWYVARARQFVEGSEVPSRRYLT